MTDTHTFQTPAECRQRARQGTRFCFGQADCQLGRFLAAWQDEKLCLLLFPTDEESPQQLITHYLGDIFDAFSSDELAARDLAPTLDAFVQGQTDALPTLCLTGTPYQHRVWQGLLRTGRGEQTTYGALARELGTHPRALGGAVGANPVSVFVPCHRVVYQGSQAQSYRWGAARKQQLQQAEAATRLATASAA